MAKVPVAGIYGKIQFGSGFCEAALRLTSAMFGRKWGGWVRQDRIWPVVRPRSSKRPGKVNKANVLARLKEIKADKEAKDEVRMLDEWLKLAGDETDLKKALKDDEAVLDAKAYAKYPKLTEAEIKTLVVDDKWLATLDVAIHGEMDRISQGLTQRVKELAERNETPMPQMVNRLAELEARVNSHLERMGFSWK